jgi:capsular exopolysaccharide synthesis family protein
MEPKDFARLLLRRKSTVVMATLIVLGTVIFGSLRAAPVYVAQCEVLFKGIGFDLSEKDGQGIEPFGSIATNLDIVTGPQVSALAATSLGWPIGDVAGKVNASVKPETQIILLQVADTPPAAVQGTPAAAERSGLICNAYAQGYIDYRRSEGAKAYERELASIRNDQINTQHDLDIARYDYEFAAQDPKHPAITVEKLNTFNNLVSLKGELDRRYTAISSRLKRGLDGEGGELYRVAGPGAKTGADLKRTGILGLIIGLMFGVGIALIREYLDDTVKDKEQTARELGLPVLANLPATSDLDGFDGPPQATIEAARTLRATLAAYGFPHERRMLLVASSLSKRRSTTLVALAGAVAESGRSVLVIGSDLRSSRTHEAFGIANTIGLANVVRGQVPLRNAIRPAPGLENVYVLPCGPVIGSPGEILSSEAMAFALREAREWADVVLLDAPPILAAADASILGAYADGVVMVVSAGRTSRAKAAEAKEQLAAAGARVLGIVLIGGDDERDRDSIDDLDGFLPTGGYGSFEPSFAGVGAGAGGDDWYGDEMITMTARTDGASRRASAPRPSKKVSAAGRDQRPRRLVEPSVPANVRTPSRRPAASAPARKPATTAKRPTATAKRPPMTAKRPTTAKKRPATAAKPAPKRKTTSASAKPRPAAKRATVAARATAKRPAAKRATARTPAKRSTSTRSRTTTRR